MTDLVCTVHQCIEQYNSILYTVHKYKVKVDNQNHKIKDKVKQRLTAKHERPSMNSTQVKIKG